MKSLPGIVLGHFMIYLLMSDKSNYVFLLSFVITSFFRIVTLKYQKLESKEFK